MPPRVVVEVLDVVLETIPRRPIVVTLARAVAAGAVVSPGVPARQGAGVYVVGDVPCGSDEFPQGNE